MVIKRVVMQTVPGQRLRKAIHKMRSKQTYETAKIFLKNWGGEELSEYAKDMYMFCKKYNYTYAEYMYYHFYEKKLKERLAYISSEERIYCCEKLNPAKNWSVFENKANTYLKFKEFFKRDVFILRKPYDKNTRKALYEFILNNPCFIAKTFYDAEGRGVKKYDLRKGQISNDWIDSFLAKYQNGCLCEELIVQSSDFAKLHPESVNGLRLTTIRFRDHVEIIHPAMRVGTGDNYVDNAGCDGIICAVDSSGKMFRAVNERGEFYETHPDTGVKFLEYRVPYFEEAMELAEKLAEVVPDNRYTGWDLAHTSEGWILIEANAYAAFLMWQLPLQQGFRNEWESIMSRI